MRWIAFPLASFQLGLMILGWLFAAAQFFSGGTALCDANQYSIFLAIWVASLLVSLGAPGMVLRCGWPGLGLLLLAGSFGNLVLWIRFGDLILKGTCTG